MGLYLMHSKCRFFVCLFVFIKSVVTMEMWGEWRKRQDQDGDLTKTETEHHYKELMLLLSWEPKPVKLLTFTNIYSPVRFNLTILATLSQFLCLKLFSSYYFSGYYSWPESLNAFKRLIWPSSCLSFFSTCLYLSFVSRWNCFTILTSL